MPLGEVVNARELHQFLESKQDFSDWIKKRIEKYKFIENVDYLNHKVMVQVPHQGGIRATEITEYLLTVDMAKEICMLEANEKGQMARRYYIACEKAYSIE